MTASERTRAATFRDVFAVAEFRALLAALVFSLVGDQLARVALSVLVYNRTRSPLLTALTYALTYLPSVLGGPLLAGYADRLPRRGVMILTDVARAVIVGAMAIPGMPLAALLCLVVLAETLSAPFSAARAAMLPEVLVEDRYVVGSAINSITMQAGQVLGFAVGGLVVAAVAPRGALLIDAVTFLISAALVRVGVRHRGVPADVDTSRGGMLGDLRAGARVVFTDPLLRALATAAWLWMFAVVPESLAAPYAAKLQAAPVAVGFILAAGPFGFVIGAFVLGRLVPPDRRLELTRPLLGLAFAPLLAFALHPNVVISVLLLCVVGFGTAYNVPANSAFMVRVAPASRGRAFALVQAGLLAGQGVAFLAAGAAAERWSIGGVFAVSGALGLVGTVALSLTWLRSTMLTAAVVTLPEARSEALSAPVLASAE